MLLDDALKFLSKLNEWLNFILLWRSADLFSDLLFESIFSIYLLRSFLFICFISSVSRLSLQLFLNFFNLCLKLVFVSVCIESMEFIVDFIFIKFVWSELLCLCKELRVNLVIFSLEDDDDDVDGSKSLKNSDLKLLSLCVCIEFDVFVFSDSLVPVLILKMKTKRYRNKRKQWCGWRLTFVEDLCFGLGLWSVSFCVVLRRLASERGCGGSTRLRRLVLATASVLAGSAIDEAF